MIAYILKSNKAKEHKQCAEKSAPSSFDRLYLFIKKRDESW